MDTSSNSEGTSTLRSKVSYSLENQTQLTDIASTQLRSQGYKVGSAKSLQLYRNQITCGDQSATEESEEDKDQVSGDDFRLVSESSDYGKDQKDLVMWANKLELESADLRETSKKLIKDLRSMTEDIKRSIKQFQALATQSKNVMKEMDTRLKLFGYREESVDESTNDDIKSDTRIILDNQVQLFRMMERQEKFNQKLTEMLNKNLWSDSRPLDDRCQSQVPKSANRCSSKSIGTDQDGPTSKKQTSSAPYSRTRSAKSSIHFG
ncbi:hypothetical protein KL930_004002 [Ogataea haglerorum]|uniref:Uncharacterized protein n=1 Tax=Ogataea haglerorum TaxID=1937702 RepID=A0AAN6D980_9ASCO|nr:uncharacterized protein KL911_001347 [Ogataea haglerorum]KAG7693394.1 hypothetical protein KL915_004293 [Ogataea haglerorum]KAG7694201.1 hypothetical protein KL951_004079 [Ogataea haglerorum]KAG7711923.1 hypothetical protein KL914_000565 [Ogataea haglerorum]KAG7712694.1 hypothetical protein KL950_000565 [Ogataea haglerorum]KAG7730407.1 hypothetical protein KL933_000202 [Ogataea haglerorum]